MANFGVASTNELLKLHAQIMLVKKLIFDPFFFFSLHSIKKLSFCEVKSIKCDQTSFKLPPSKLVSAKLSDVTSE